jgi:CRISPR-associated protein Cas2
VKLLAIYDITSDRLRTEAAEVCKDFGLSRIQLSCFAGDLSQNRRGMLEIRLVRLLQRKEAQPTDAIYLLPMCLDCFEGKMLLGRRAHFPDKNRDLMEML